MSFWGYVETDNGQITTDISEDESQTANETEALDAETEDRVEDKETEGCDQQADISDVDVNETEAGVTNGESFDEGINNTDVDTIHGSDETADSQVINEQTSDVNSSVAGEGTLLTESSKSANSEQSEPVKVSADNEYSDERVASDVYRDTESYVQQSVTLDDETIESKTGTIVIDAPGDDVKVAGYDEYREWPNASFTYPKPLEDMGNVAPVGRVTYGTELTYTDVVINNLETWYQINDNEWIASTVLGRYTIDMLTEYAFYLDEVEIGPDNHTTNTDEPVINDIPIDTEKEINISDFIDSVIKIEEECYFVVEAETESGGKVICETRPLSSIMTSIEE